MAKRPSYEELEQRVRELKKETVEREQVEKVLRKERDRAQQYLDIEGVIILAINTKGEVTVINKKGCEVLVYKQKDIIGKVWFDNFLPERIRDEVKEVSQKLLAGEIELAEYFENPVLTKSGQERTVAWHNSTLKDEAGNIVGHLSSGDDVTEQKHAEEALRESEARFRRLVEHATDAFFLHDFDGRIHCCPGKFPEIPITL